VDFKGHSPRTHVKKGDSIAVVDHGSSLKVRNRWTGRIVGPGHAQTLIFLERATIRTTVFTNGYVAARGGLWGEKWVGLKPLLSCPQSCISTRT
jgi:hypothetical protein